MPLIGLTSLVFMKLLMDSISMPCVSTFTQAQMLSLSLTYNIHIHMKAKTTISLLMKNEWVAHVVTSLAEKDGRGL